MPSSFSSFLWGAFLAFILIAVNHRRIHRDDIRKTIFDAVLNMKTCASEYWLSEYDEKRRSDLEGSCYFLKSIMPLSHRMMNKKQIFEMEILLRGFIVDLMSKDEMTQEHHKISPDRVIKIHKMSGLFLKQYYSIYLKQTNVITLTIYPRWIQIGNLYPLWLWLKNLFKNGGA